MFNFIKSLQFENLSFQTQSMYQIAFVHFCMSVAWPVVLTRLFLRWKGLSVSGEKKKTHTHTKSWKFWLTHKPHEINIFSNPLDTSLTWSISNMTYLFLTWRETYLASKHSTIALDAWSINFCARPNRRWERFTAWKERIKIFTDLCVLISPVISSTTIICDRILRTRIHYRHARVLFTNL